MYFGNICRRCVDVVKGGRRKANLLLIGRTKITKLFSNVFSSGTSELSIQNSANDWFSFSFEEIGSTVFAEIYLTVCLFCENYLTASVYFVEGCPCNWLE